MRCADPALQAELAKMKEEGLLEEDEIEEIQGRKKGGPVRYSALLARAQRFVVVCGRQ